MVWGCSGRGTGGRRPRPPRGRLCAAKPLVVAATLAAAAFMQSSAGPASGAPAAEERPEETLCRLIETAAAANDLPVAFFTRLIWRESSFRAGVVSRAGAQGIAQFMPGTAAERGLLDPFDPEQAIPASASLLKDLTRRFGNLGLAAASYNAGPRRVTDWMLGDRTLPGETQAYVHFVTGRLASDWLADLSTEPPKPVPMSPETDCLKVVAAAKVESPGLMREGPMAPWGVQVSGNFSKARALSAFSRVQERHASVLAGELPVVIGSRMRGRGTRTYYRVRIGAPDRQAANALCSRLKADGGACIVLKN